MNLFSTRSDGHVLMFQTPDKRQLPGQLHFVPFLDFLQDMSSYFFSLTNGLVFKEQLFCEPRLLFYCYSQMLLLCLLIMLLTLC